MTSRTVALSLAAGAAAIAVGVFTGSFEGDPVVVDTPVYRNYGERITNGDFPYRDFSVEYPPGALAPFVLPALVTSTQQSYDSAFRAEMIAMLVLASVLVVLALVALGASTGRIALAVGALLLGTALLGSFILARFDVFAATVTLAAMCAIVYRRQIAAPVLLGLAIATKIYPAVLLPLLVTRIWRGEGRAAALRGLALTVAAALAVYLPFALVAPKGVTRSVWDQLGRPLQIESLGSGVLLAFHHAFGMPLGWSSGSGSQNLTGTVAGVAATLTTIAGAAALILVWMRYARGDVESDERFVRYAAAAVVAFVAFGKVLSPQFLMWLLGIVVLVQARRGVAAIALLVLACGLTRLWFPRTYWELVKAFDPTASWLVLVRDLALVALFAVLVVRSRALEPKAREPEPV